MKFNICIPIPIKNIDLKQIDNVLNKALAFNPEIIEFRFDYIENSDFITKNFVRELINLLKEQSLVIFTFRRYSEGGKSKTEESKRLKILQLLIEAQPDFLDVEMNSDLETLSKLITLSQMNKVNLVFSYHNFENTPSYELAKQTVLRFEEKIIKNELNEFNTLEKSIYKCIFTAQIFEDNLVPLRLCKDFSKANRKIISFCMGKLGIFSRIMSLNSGSFLTYASLEEKTAPGQIKIDTLQEIYKLLNS